MSAINIRTTVEGAGNSELNFKVEPQSLFDASRLEKDINAIVQEIKSIAGCYITPQTKLQIIPSNSGKVVIRDYGTGLPNGNPSYQHLLRAIPRGNVTIQQIERGFSTMPR